MYREVFTPRVGEVFTHREVLALLESKFPGENMSSANTSDYRGVRNPRTGNVELSPRQSSQYAELIFEGTGDTYKVLPVDERISKHGTRSVGGFSDADLIAEAARRGMLAASAPAHASPTTEDLSMTTKKPKAVAGKIHLKWVVSAICAPVKQKLVVKGLGFTRLNQVIERPDNAAIRGMVAKVPHLVEILK